MKKRNLKKLTIKKESIVAFNSIFGGALPTTQQSTVAFTNEGLLCETINKDCQATSGICPTNYFDC
ncbi:hypothetical protein [Kordia jejudonensis]|uniref:hypothetical protein n=1 Tax=Kordia jejudonensis TaxID=1348245 RepID=UPI000629036F|nr:hypothetical protein [Kordia jejudonensis]